MLYPNPIIDVQRAAISGNIYAALRRYAEETHSGTAFPPGLFYALWHRTPDVNRARVPDASFVRRERMDEHHDALMPFHGAPDLGVLVISPNQIEIDPFLPFRILLVVRQRRLRLLPHNLPPLSQGQLEQSPSVQRAHRQLLNLRQNQNHLNRLPHQRFRQI